MASTALPRGLPRASAADALALAAEVVGPTVAKGAILRRPRVVGAAERWALDQRALRRMQRLRDRYGPGPLMVRLPSRWQAVLLYPAHVRRVLEGTPEPFSAASREKRAALSHFEPDAVLITRGPLRVERRRYNDAVLDGDCPRHRPAARFEAVVREEAALLLAGARRAGVLSWDAFIVAWFRAARRVVLGDGARDDHALTELLRELRSDANWAMFTLRRLALRDRFFARLEAHLARAEPGSLAAVMAATPAGAATAAAGQVPQWLVAFDAAGVATFRALALLAAHPAYADAARNEATAADAGAGKPTLPRLRAAVLEALRLWPTTPMVLRQTTAETQWEGGTMPAGTGILIFAAFFHRDDTRLPYADRFAPELWLSGDAVHTAVRWAPADGPLIPFSAGPAVCPGRHLALLLASTMLAAIVRDGPVRLLAPAPGAPARLDAARPLPGTLDNYTLRFGTPQFGRGD